MSVAVLVVDLQKAYVLPDGPLARSGVDTSLLADAGQRCRVLLDWARANALPVVLTRKISDDAYPTGISFGEPGIQLIREGGLALNGPATQLLDGVRADGDIVIDKLGFSAFQGTRLDSTLRALEIEHLLVAGLTTAICIESTVRAAVDHRYEVTVVADAVAEAEEARHKHALRAIEYAFASLTTLRDVTGDGALEGVVS